MLIKLLKYNNYLIISQRTQMVQLQFEVEVSGPFQSVWKYFSQFENVPDWDPNTTNCEVIRKNQNQIGSVYSIVSIFNEKQSTVSYQTTQFKETKDRGYISLEGKNDMITANDQIICTRKGENSTLFKYRADISLRGFYWLFTPFIKGGLNKLTEHARNGCIKRSTQKWGKATLVV